MLSTTALRQFAEIARSGSLRAAADRLFVAASAVSRNLRLLEEDLGAPLFDRGRGRIPMRLTEAGELVFAMVQKLESEVQRTRDEIEALRRPARQIFRLGLSQSMTQEFVPDFLTAYRIKHPQVDFEARVEDSVRVLELLREGVVDVALVFNAPLLTGVRSVYERSLSTCILVSADHPLAQKDIVGLDECAEYPMTLPDASAGLMRVNEEVFMRARVRPQRALISNSYDLIRNASAAGLGLAVVAEPLSVEFADQRSQRYVPLANARPRSFAVFVRQGVEVDEGLQSFVDDLVLQLRELAATRERVRKVAVRSRKGNKLR